MVYERPAIESKVQVQGLMTFKGSGKGGNGGGYR